MKKILFLLSILIAAKAQSQIVIDNLAPYNTPGYLIDNVLLGGGIVASNHTFQGDPSQIGWFNGLNSNLDIDSGIVLSSGNVLQLIGPNASGSTTASFSGIGDLTLDLIVAPDVTNDAAVLEFDFVPTSDVLSFKYVFGSEEYLEFVTSFNDAFGFFLSGPNPAGGMYVDENIAIIPGTINTPVSIFNVNNVSNSAYYIDNGDGFTAPQNTDPTVIQFDGFTTPLTATADVNCGDTYHIKIVVADVNDWSYDSGVFLEAGSFYSPPLNIVDNLGIDSAYMSIPCNSTITLTANGGAGATYQWFDSTSTVFSTASTVNVGEGTYVVSADISGCAVFSDTLIVEEGDFPTFSFGPDLMIACNSDTLIDPVVSGGTAPYTYLWNSGQSDSMLTLAMGNYQLTVTDFYGCSDSDTINIIEDPIPQATISGGGSICDDGSKAAIEFTFNGLLPWDLTYTNGSADTTINNIDDSTYSISTLDAGSYEIVLAADVNDCIASDSGIANVIVNPLPIAVITPNEITIYFGEEIALTTTETYIFYEWYTEYGDSISNEEILTVQDSGRYKVWVEDGNGCTDKSELAIVRSVPLTQLFIPLAFTPNDDEHNELFVIKGLYIQTFNIKIFDRWGNQLFESDTIDKYWDGTFENKKVQQGTYYYHIEVLGLDSKLFEKSGNIQVLY